MKSHQWTKDIEGSDRCGHCGCPPVLALRAKVRCPIPYEELVAAEQNIILKQLKQKARMGLLDYFEANKIRMSLRWRASI